MYFWWLSLRRALLNLKLQIIIFHLTRLKLILICTCLEVSKIRAQKIPNTRVFKNKYFTLKLERVSIVTFPKLRCFPWAGHICRWNHSEWGGRGGGGSQNLRRTNYREAECNASSNTNIIIRFDSSLWLP